MECSTYLQITRGHLLLTQATDGSYQPPMNGAYQVHLECTNSRFSVIFVCQRRTGSMRPLFSHDSRLYNRPHPVGVEVASPALFGRTHPLSRHASTGQHVSCAASLVSMTGRWSWCEMERMHRTTVPLFLQVGYVMFRLIYMYVL